MSEAEADVRNTLNERGSRYGRFDAHARRSRALIRAAEAAPNWPLLAADQQHAVNYILDKIGRILTGDPTYQDNWHDIAGYAQLILDRLNGTGIYATSAASVNSPVVQTYQCSDFLGGCCVECGQPMGNAHLPNCRLLKDPNNPGGSAGS
jgi:hypothetical protein